MIVEKQTVKSKSELQAVIQKTRLGKAMIYKPSDKRQFFEIASDISDFKNIAVIIITN